MILWGGRENDTGSACRPLCIPFIVFPLDLFPGNSLSGPDAGSRVLDFLEESGVILQLKIEPIVIPIVTCSKTGKNTDRPTVLHDDDLPVFRLGHVLGEVVSELGKFYLLHDRNRLSPRSRLILLLLTAVGQCWRCRSIAFRIFARL